MTDLTLPTPECFKPLAQPSRYKAAYGARGSGKSWHFASMIVEHCLLNPGALAVDGATKRMVYEPYNVIFYLTKKQVYMIDVTSDLPH